MTSYRYVKRALDIIGAAGILTATSPVIAVTAVLVRRIHGRPVLFTQERPGQDGQIFRLFKFRSMRNVDHRAGLVSDEERLTDFGRWLRSTSLDELPSLLNVLKGDMSFVGPRPLLVDYLERYSAVQARRHLVRPGITGLAQISGRNLVGWDERFRLDVEYVETMSLRTDLRILAKTLGTVLTRKGVSAEGHVTMSEFQGSMVNSNQSLLRRRVSQEAVS